MEYRQDEDPGHDGRKGDTPEYVRRMQKELSEVLGEASSREELRLIEPRAREVAERHRDELADADVREPVIHCKVVHLNYSRRLAEASAVRAHAKAEDFPCAGDGDRLRCEGRQKVGGGAGEDGGGVRCWVLQEAAGEGVGGGGVCVWAEQFMRLQIQGAWSIQSYVWPKFPLSPEWPFSETME